MSKTTGTRSITDQLIELCGLRESWDSYRAQPITPAALATAAQLAFVFQGLGWTPVMVPVADGGINLEWDFVGFELEILIRPDGQPRHEERF